MAGEFFLEGIAEETGLGRNAQPFPESKVLYELDKALLPPWVSQPARNREG